jgi:enoyl-CoA hydratase/carnithine racemase
MCDLRIASENAVFAESFVKLGLVSAAGGAWFLSRCVSPAVAAELTLTGASITAARALELGIVSRVVPPADLMNEALALAARITCHSPHAVRLNKRLLRAARGQDLTAALEMAASLQAVAQHTSDQHEAVAAIIEKRKPIFEGR